MVVMLMTCNIIMKDAFLELTDTGKVNMVGKSTCIHILGNSN